MSFKLWSKFVLFTVASFFVLTASINYTINPYHIFEHSLFSSIIKTKNHSVSGRMSTFYIGKHTKPQSLIMGSSRIGMFSQSIFEKYLGEKVYIMAMPGSNIEEQSEYLIYMINNYPIKNIVWGLDFFGFNPDLPKDPDFTYDRLSSSFMINNDYKIALFSLQTTKNSFRTIIDNLKVKQKPVSIESIKKTSNKKYHSLSTKEIRQRTNYQISNYKKKYLKVKTFNKPNTIDENLKRLKKVVDLCKQKDVKAYIYTSPVQKSFLDLYSKLNLDSTFKYWKTQLPYIIGYTDFNNYNSVTNKSSNFVDGTHIMPHYEKQIFAKVFHDNSIDIPNDFGRYFPKKSTKE